MNAVLQRPTILVVDDEPQVLSAIEDTLEDEYRVVVQTSPRIAIRIVEKEPDLSVIISDQRMPGMAGDEFLARAREVSDASRVMITGYADLNAVVRAVNNGRIFSYISKPWDPDQLKLVAYKAVEHHNLLRELSEEQRLLHNLMDNVPDAIFFKDLERRYVRINRAFAAGAGLACPEDAIGRSARDLVSPKDSLAMGEALAMDEEDGEILRAGDALVDRVRRIVVSGGEPRWFSITKAPIKDERGMSTGLVGIARDITNRQQAEEKVRRLNRVYAVLSGINAVIVRVRERAELFREACRIAVEHGKFRLAWIGEIDSGARQLRPAAWAGEAEFAHLARQIPGPEAQKPGLVGKAILSLRPQVCNDIEAQGTEMLYRDEAIAHGLRAAAVLPLAVGGAATGVLALYSDEPRFFDDAEMELLRELAADISFALDHIEKGDRLNYLAFYDEVTGLANRTLFHNQLGQALHAAERQRHVCAVLNVNLDRFKAINDSLGRAAGDGLLRQIAGRIAGAVRGTDQVARISADQFAVVFPNVRGEDEVARLIEEMTRRWFGEPFRLDDTELRVSAKAGIALYPNDGQDAETLFRNSESALNRAKTKGERYLFYTQQMTERTTETLMLENKLRRALENEEFVLYYQPKVSLQDRSIAGAEALIRWNSPDRGLVPPGKFIGLLEDTGMIREVGAWALKRAALDHSRWVQRGFAAPRVAVNVSATQLRSRDFVDAVRDAIRQGASPPGIDLEITESVLMDDINANIEKLGAVRALNVNIAIDDFGTGYSSLGYLAKLPVQSLKIDRSFVITMLNDPNVMTLVSTIISLAHSLGLKVIAEGVEADEQARMLRLLKCDEMQGYLFSRPLPFDDITALLKQAGPDRA